MQLRHEEEVLTSALAAQPNKKDENIYLSPQGGLYR